jgi:hypothetical protein
MRFERLVADRSQTQVCTKGAQLRGESKLTHSPYVPYRRDAAVRWGG